MKKIAYKKSLQLNKEVVRALVASDLREVDGGLRNNSRSACGQDCQPQSGNVCQF